MDNLIYVLFISIFSPLFLMMLLVEKKARLPLIFVLLGMFVSLFAAELNGVIIRLFDIGMREAAVTIAPITEEILKALPPLFFAIVISDKRETLFTASMATGIGFAILENVYFLLTSYESISLLSAVVRGFGTGLMHGMCTLLIGFGISFVKKKKKLFFVGIFALFTTAITYHSIFNMLIASKYSMIGAFLPIVTYIPFFVWRHFDRSAFQGRDGSNK